MTARVRIGISGWRYAGWRKVFYPDGLAQRRELEFAGATFPTLEINGTHYSLQRPESFAAWRDAVPEDFVFAVKGSRYLTHMLRLKDIEAAAASFWAQGLLRLGPKLGPILWQFPKSFRFEPERLEPFLASLPHDTAEAAALARRHDHRVEGRAWTESDATRPLRHAIEVRHDDFDDPAFFDLLRRYGVGLVVSDAVGWPCLMEVTADFVYVRLHGSVELYTSGYEAPDLDRWAERVEGWRKRGLDVYVYFDNDAKVRAPFDAQGLMRRVAPPDRPASHHGR